ncbi:MAG: DoxX family protein [Chlamydiales bacterium]|nr:DoxX family protein [Chlamydiales bacterium]
MKIIVLLGRIFYSAIFILSSFGHFTSATVQYAASQGVPMAHLLVPISGILALLGGLSILLGYRARYGAWLLVIFLVPVTLMIHNYWVHQDQARVMIEQVMFMKNISMLGAALLIAYFGSGPLSLDKRR